MSVNSLPETVTRQRRDCDLNLGPSAPESSMLTSWLLSHPWLVNLVIMNMMMNVFGSRRDDNHNSCSSDS